MLSGTAGTPLPLCPLPARHSLGSRPLQGVASHLKRTPRATGLPGLGFLVFVVVFFLYHATSLNWMPNVNEITRAPNRASCQSQGAGVADTMAASG